MFQSTNNDKLKQQCNCFKTLKSIPIDAVTSDHNTSLHSFSKLFQMPDEASHLPFRGQSDRLTGNCLERVDPHERLPEPWERLWTLKYKVSC